jgi:F like protein
MASSGAEDSVYQAAKNGLQLWLGRVKDAVLASWREFQAVPNANEVYSTVPVWQAQVDKIIAALTPALIEGWSAAHLPYDFDPQDPYIQANLALTNNLLVRIPDEVHAMIVKEILEGTSAGETTAQIAARVERVLQYTGSENWDGRAQLIAQTETTRHRNSSALAHGLLVEKQDNRILMKRWHTTMDGREREAHKLTNNQVRTLNQPFDVQGVPMLYPGDPTAPPELVCNCRCDVELMPAGR